MNDSNRFQISSTDPQLRAKLEALAEFAAGAGHEINNPVATIVGRAELLLRNETQPERRQALLTIGAQALRIRDMIGDLMLFARPPKPEPQLLDFTQVVTDVIAKLEESFRAKSLTVTQSGDNIPIWADPVQLRIVISNLLQNSVNASADRCSIRLDCSCRVEESRDWAILSVHDRGCGFNPTEREHLFDPFFSGRQAGRGIGFGLPKCWRIVDQHGGRIECESTPDDGTTFRVIWPGSA